MPTNQTKDTNVPTKFIGKSGNPYRLDPALFTDESTYTMYDKVGGVYHTHISIEQALKDYDPSVDETVAPKRKPFTDEIYQHLPSMLRDGCNTLYDMADKEVFLVSSLGVLSGLMPNVEGIYDGARVSTNLFVYVLGSYGSGKGAMRYARLLADPVHKKKTDRNKISRMQFEQKLCDYNEAMKQHRKGTCNLPVYPDEPKTELLFIPANNSKSGMIELLKDNGGRGIVYETEGDTLADAFKQDYGNFSDLFRKGFHHEAVSLFRRGGKELIEIERPEFSGVVSSTFDQLTNLMPTAENGLYSRFLYYELEANHTFHDVFNDQKSDYENQFSRLAEKASLMYDKLDERTVPVKFSFTAEQKDRFVTTFREMKERILTKEDPDLNGTVNRLGLIAFRIVMMLTIVRSVETGYVFDLMACSDEDYNNTLAIVEHLGHYATSVFFRLPKKSVRTAFVDRQADKVELMKQVEELNKQGLSKRRIARDLNMPESTIRSWLNKKT